MKTIGLLGGMSWESTVIYYKAINESIRDKLGGLHSAKITMCSVDFEELEKLQRQNKWSEIATVLSNSAKLIESGGADFLLMCVNTMHKVASEVESSVSIPLVHIADATGRKLVADDIKKVGLLGTRFTMGESFYKQRIINKFGIDVIVPDIDAQDTIHNIIYNELCLGIIDNKSRQHCLEIVDTLHKSGAEAIVLGCTELPLLLQQNHTDIPLYNTTAIHAEEAVLLALKG